jgi:GNAT superfamily N-acetyltransferase
MELELHLLRDRPDLVEGFHALGGQVWQRFMQQDPHSEDVYAGIGTTWSDCGLVAVADGEVACRAVWVPLPWDGTLPLPHAGWDWAARTAIRARRLGEPCRAASALEIGVRPDLRGGGLSGRMLAGMRAAVRDAGLTDLFAPVRPNRKSDVPHLPMAEYAARTRADGLPEDPWLRVHARAGGELLGPCERSMRIEGTVEDWRDWTGQDLSAPGEHLVDGALAPVVSDGSWAEYVEPNVWVRHRVG